MANKAPTIPDKTLYFSEIKDGSVLVTWKRASDKETAQAKLQYNLSWRRAGEPSCNSKWTGWKQDMTSYRITNLYSNTKYEVELAVYDGKVTANYDTGYFVSKGNTAPTLPSSGSLESGKVAIAGENPNSFTIIWNKATDKETAQRLLRYIVYWNVSGKPSTQKNSGWMLDACRYVISGLLPNTKYDICVKVSDGENTVSYKTISRTTLQENTAPTVANNRLYLKEATDTSLTIAWNKATDKETAQKNLEYQVSWQLLPDGDLRKSNWLTDINSYKIVNCRPNSDFEFHVSVRDARLKETKYGSVIVTTKSEPNTKPVKSTFRKRYPVSFEFLGNMPWEVKKTNVNLGDGDMAGGGIGEITAYWVNLGSPYKYQLFLKFRCYESKYGSKQSHDSLEFTATKEITLSVADFPLKNVDGEQIVWQIGTSEDSKKTVFYKDSFEDGWQSINPSRYATMNRMADWMPVTDLKIKVDSSGNELTGRGKIGVIGTAYLEIEAVKTTYVKVAPSSTPVFTDSGTISQGNNAVLALANEYDVKEVLGYGFDITTKFASKEGIGASPVLDLEKINKYKRIKKCNPTGAWTHKYEKSSSEEYTREISKEFSIEVAANIFGATFKNTTKQTKTSTTKEKNNYTLTSAMWLNKVQQYEIEYVFVNELRSFLADTFKTRVNELCKLYPALKGTEGWKNKVDEFFSKMGTHVITGMVTGGRADMHMSHKVTSKTISEAKTFTNSTTIGYNAAGTDIVAKDDKSKSGEGKGDDLLKKAEEAKDVETLKGIVVELVKQSKKTGEKDSSTAKGNGVSITAMYNLKETMERITNEEITDLEIELIGGNLMVNPFTDENATFDKWRASFNAKNTVWCDFVKNGVVPIYQFAPDESSMKILHQAWNEYCRRNGIECEPVGKAEYSEPIALTGLGTHVEKYEGNKCDKNVCTSDEWPTGWKIRLDLVNLKEERGIGLAIRYQVVEGQRTQNSLPENQIKMAWDEMTETNLVLTYVYPLRMHDCAVNTDEVISTFEVQGVKKGDQTGKWVDITTNVKEAIKNYERRNSGKRCMVDLNAPGSKFEIRLEQRGDDDSNALGLKFQLWVPSYEFHQ